MLEKPVQQNLKWLEVVEFCQVRQAQHAPPMQSNGGLKVQGLELRV
jgi:hypothetical protein